MAKQPKHGGKSVSSDDVNEAVGEVTLKHGAGEAQEGGQTEGETPKAEAPAGPKLPRGVSSEQVVRLQKDKQDNSYGPENNPKRPGSKAATRFALYKDGMTVKEALEAGVTGSDLTYDVNKGFIKLETAA